MLLLARRDELQLKKKTGNSNRLNINLCIINERVKLILVQY